MNTQTPQLAVAIAGCALSLYPLAAEAAVFQIDTGFTSSTAAGGTVGNVISTTTGAVAGSYSISLSDGANNPLTYRSTKDRVVDSDGATFLDPDTVAIGIRGDSGTGGPGAMEVLSISLNVSDPSASYQQIIFESGLIDGNNIGAGNAFLSFTPTWTGGGFGEFTDAPGGVAWVAPYDVNTVEFTSGTTIASRNTTVNASDQWAFVFPTGVTAVDIAIAVTGTGGDILNDSFHVSFVVVPEPSRATLLGLAAAALLLRRRRGRKG